MRIAIVRLSAMGDIINSAFILKAIKEKYPQATVEWFCEAAFAPLLEHHPYLDAVHTVSLKQIKKNKSFKLLKETIQKLKALGPYDKVIDLQGLVKSALVAKFLGKERYGFDKKSIREPFAALFYQHKVTIPYAENSLWRTAVLTNFALGTQITPQDLTESGPSLFYQKTDTIKELLKRETNILFVTGSSQPYKNYPLERIIQTIQGLDHHIILIWGSENEFKDAQSIHNACPNTTVAPKLTLNELVALVDAVDLTIGNDTGPTHISWALDKKSITLFGATPAAKMMWQTDHNLAIESDSVVNPLKLDKNDFSIAQIDPAKIISTAQRLLDA